MKIAQWHMRPKKFDFIVLKYNLLLLHSFFSAIWLLKNFPTKISEDKLLLLRHTVSFHVKNIYFNLMGEINVIKESLK